MNKNCFDHYSNYILITRTTQGSNLLWIHKWSSIAIIKIVLKHHLNNNQHYKGTIGVVSYMSVEPDDATPAVDILGEDQDLQAVLGEWMWNYLDFDRQCWRMDGKVSRCAAAVAAALNVLFFTYLVPMYSAAALKVLFFTSSIGTTIPGLGITRSWTSLA